LTADIRNESLELGMADTLINRLSPFKQIIVRPISQVRKYTGLEQNPIAAGRELGVDYVLEGNLQVVGDKTRATVSFALSSTARSRVGRAREYLATAFSFYLP